MKAVQGYHLVAMLLVALFLAVTAGCGGGGSSIGGVVNLGSGNAKAAIQMSTQSLAINDSATVTATFTDASGKAIANLPVTFTTTLGSLNPASGAATTDAAGAATMQLLAGSTAGAGSVTATATVNGSTVTAIQTFAVALPALSLVGPTLGLSTLQPGGTTGVSVTVTDANGTPYPTPVDVTFSSLFAGQGKATLISPVRTVNGVAASTYTAAGGVGTDTITVSVAGATATATLTVNGPVANSISFVSAAPKNISLRGMGGVGASETSTVVFKVLDVNGNPKSSQLVDFTLNTTVGGLALTADSASSAADGTVSTTVKSGIVATPIRVTATIRGSSPPIATQSDLLVVSTGIPAQDGFSLSVVTLNPETYNVDGVTDVFTARLADHFGNPVPDGTAVYFTAQSGSIDPSCTTVTGACSVTWRSQGTRPADGQSAILAYAVGEESFVDLNGNGVADAGTCVPSNPLESAQCGEFIDTTQAYRDDAHTGIYETSDPFIDFNGTGKVDRDGIFNGILRPASVTGFRTKHVFSNNVIVMSTSGATIKIVSVNGAPNGTTINPATGNPLVPAASYILVSVQDQNLLKNNPMPSGTTVVFGAAGGTCLAIDSTTTSYTVPNTTVGPGYYYTVVTNSCATGKSGIINITVTSPGGVITRYPLSVSW